jgi:hypothetical protein
MKRFITALAVAASAAVAGCGKSTGPSGGGGDDNFGLENVPKFETTSTEPVLLRNKLKVGQVEKAVIDLALDMRIRQGDKEQKLDMSMHMAGSFTVKAVDDEGVMSGVVRFTRLKMKMSGLADVEFDSDKPGQDRPELEAIREMLKADIPCKVTPEGKFLEADIEVFRLAARKLGNPALSQSLEDSTKKMFEGTFIQLSVTPVKAGDTYKAGTLSEGKVKVDMSYKVRAVSGDRTKAILEPRGEMKLEEGAFPPSMDVKIKDQRLGGWALFDVQNGHLIKGEVHLHATLEMSSRGQTGTMEMKAKTTVTASVE